MSETLTRAELAELIYSEVGISKTEASEIVDQFFDQSRFHVNSIMPVSNT